MAHLIWKNRDRRSSLDDLGLLIDFLSADDPRSAREQLNDNYRHGGGWSPLPGWTMLPGGAIKYPGDPVLFPLWEVPLRDELVLVYSYAWVAVVQKDGTFEIARID